MDVNTVNDSIRCLHECIQRMYENFNQKMDDIDARLRNTTEIARKTANSINVVVRLLAGSVKMKSCELQETLLEADAHLNNLMPNEIINPNIVPPTAALFNELRSLVSELNVVVNSMDHLNNSSLANPINPIDVVLSSQPCMKNPIPPMSNDKLSVQSPNLSMSNHNLVVQSHSSSTYNHNSSVQSPSSSTFNLNTSVQSPNSSTYNNDLYEQSLSTSNYYSSKNFLDTETQTVIIENSNGNTLTNHNIQVERIAGNNTINQFYKNHEQKDKIRRFYKNKYNYKYKNSSSKPTRANCNTSKTIENNKSDDIKQIVVANCKPSECGIIIRPINSISPCVLLNKNYVNGIDTISKLDSTKSQTTKPSRPEVGARKKIKLNNIERIPCKKNSK